ncbi:transmembrane amino acid transporter protein-domain-containing protein [Helicostylum pulchrum]|nr:transmembrane amino acid transporter protein-domain-containing protein [Helicostylum pulchrum]
MSTSKGIGSFGSTALLVSSMTGPGLATIPALFQQSGWVAPVFIFIIVAFLSGCSALFVCEALSNIRGNEKFQAKVELTTIAQVYLGTKYHYFFQLMLFLALQSVNVASIIIAAQTFDNMLITVFKGSCGLGVYPGGWFCISGDESFNPDDYFIFTFGFLLTAVMVVPLGFFSLVENIVVQMTSFIVLAAILVQWTVEFAQEGLKSELLPASGSNSTMVLGIVIFNYSFITTIPSWVNSLKPEVNIHKCLWISVVISTIFYIVLGVCGSMAYQMSASSDILDILSSQGSTVAMVTSYIFPVCALITSIPVFTIVIRSNLLPHYKQKIGSIQFKIGVVYSFNPEKNLQVANTTLAYPSPILQNADNNDVRMFNPDDNYSISIRRSSIRPSKHSQMEQSGIAYSPMMDKSGIPTIVYSDITSFNDPAHASNQSPIVPYSPNNLKAPRQNQSHISASPAPSSSQTALSSRKSTNGLGIFDPVDTDSVKDTLSAAPQGFNNSSAPGSPRSFISKKDSGQPPTSPKQGKTFTPMPTSPEISEAPPYPNSPNKPFQHHTSMLASALSFKSSVVVPETDVPKLSEEEINHEKHRFVAFHSRRGFNPFYLAIVSCAALSISISFMIVFDVTMLALGDDVLSE